MKRNFSSSGNEEGDAESVSTTPSEKKRRTSTPTNSSSHSPESDTFNTNLFQQSLKCPICTEFVKDNRECPKCHQLYCYNCIFSTKTTSNPSPSIQILPSSSSSVHVNFQRSPSPPPVQVTKITHILKCPCCRAEWSKGVQDLSQNVFVERIVSQIEVECPLHCGSRISRGDLKEHQLKYCPEFEIECVNKDIGCSFPRDKRSVIMKHQAEECLMREVTCACNKVLYFKDLQFHKTSDCPLEDMTCTIPQCNAKLKRSELEEHQKLKCPYATVSCLLEEFGCTWKGERRGMDAHIAKGCQFSFLKPFFMQFKHQIAQLEGKVHLLEEQVKKLQTPIVSVPQQVFHDIAPSSSVSTTSTNTAASNSLVPTLRNSIPKYICVSADKLVYLMDLETGSIVKQLSGHSDHVTCMCVHKGKLITFGFERCMKVWDLTTGECIKSIQAPSANTVICAMISYAGYLFAALFNGAIEVWDTDNSRVIMRMSDPSVPSVISLTPHKGCIAAGGGDGTVVVWDILMNRIVKRLKGHLGFALSCKPHQGNLYTCASSDKTIRVWDISTGDCVKTLQGHTEGVFNLCTHDQYLLSSSMDSTIKYWNTESGQCVRTLKCRGVQALVRNGDLLFSNSRGPEGGTITVWNIPTGEKLKQIQLNHARLVVAMCTSENVQYSVAQEDIEKENAARHSLELRSQIIENQMRNSGSQNAIIP